MFEIDKSVFFVFFLQPPPRVRYRLSKRGSSFERDKIHVCVSGTVGCLLDCDAVAMELSWLSLTACCTSGGVPVVLNVSCFRMMEGLCAHNIRKHRCSSFTESQLRLDVLKLFSPRIGDIIPTPSLSGGSLLSLPSSPVLPQVHFQQVNLQD